MKFLILVKILAWLLQWVLIKIISISRHFSTLCLNAGMSYNLMSTIKPCLKLGNGYPWAGQVKATPSPSRFLKEEDSNMEVNFGIAWPIGSIKRFYIGVHKRFFIYLKTGTGAPWAGHVKSIEVPDVFWKADSFRMDENLGFVLPIGSRFIKKHLKQKSFYLNAGIGDPWAGQVKAKAWPDLMCNVNDFKTEANLGFALPIGSKKMETNGVYFWQNVT